MDFGSPNQWAGYFFSTHGLVRTGSAGWLRAAIAWDSTGWCGDPADASTCDPAGPDDDLALLVFDAGMANVVAWSDSIVDNYEVVIEQLTPNTDYRLVIAQAGVPPRQPYTFYGIAWTTQDDICSP